MIEDVKLKFTNYFAKGHERTLKARRNIALSFLFKGGTIGVGLIMVPLTINYINQTQYGIWITLSSVIGWFSFFDIGLGNGLKNKLAEANALKQYDKSVIYLSTTYAILTIIAVILFLVFSIANHFINWSGILNSPGEYLNRLALIVFGFFCMQFVVQIINTVLTAYHASSKVSMINLLGQSICVILIFVLTKTTAASLIYLAFILGGTPVLIQFLVSLWFYNTDYKIVRPSIKAIDFSYAKQLLSTGGVFFILQIGALILYQTDNIIIAQLFGPGDVTVFNVCLKLFGTFIMIFNIVLSPLWTAYTDAYAKGDFEWMKNNLKSTRKIWALISLLSVVALILSPFIFRIWLHGKVYVPLSISLAMFLSTVSLNWFNFHCFVLNGINKVRLQLYLYIFSIVFNVPLAILLSKYFGLAGVTLSNVVMFVIMGILLSIQCNKILNKKAGGLWNK